jgi:alanine racemase
MDTTLVDVTGLRVRPGDVAVLWGAGGQAVEDAAALVSSISYELCCQVSRRVPRVYVS